MCANEECSSEEFSIEELGLGVIGLLERYELTKFEDRFGEHPEIQEDLEDRLIEATFPYRNLCWYCAKPFIELSMNWKFDLLDEGIPLQSHGELLHAIEELGELAADWSELFLFFYRGSADPWTKPPVKWVHIDELVALFVESASRGLTPDGLSAIQSWYNAEYFGSITIETLMMMLACGFRNESDLELLHSSEIDLDEFFWTEFPSRGVLERFESGLLDYVKYRSVLERNLANHDGDTESDQVFTVKLLETGVPVEQLLEVSDEILEDLDMEIVFADLAEDLSDKNGIDIVSQFINSIIAIKAVNLEISQENVVQFWGLSPSLILFLIDNGLDNSEHCRLGRLTNDVEDFSSWLLVLDEIGQPFDWVKQSFMPNEALSWKNSGFDPISASKWREVVDNPVAARRRVDAGILLNADKSS